MYQKGMIVLSGWSRQELGALIDSGAVHTTLHRAKKDAEHAIALDSLVDHKDHCQTHDGVFVLNCGIDGAGIGMTGLFVKTIDFNKMFVIMND